MKHPTELERIEFVAGRLPAAQRAALERHLAECEACRRWTDDQRRAWDLAGAWRAEEPRADIAAGVLARADRPGGIVWSGRLGLLARAAAVLLAALAGHLAGRVVRDREARMPALSAQAASAASEALCLEALGQDSPVGLSRALAPFAETGPEEETP
ncbi:MAG: zf-HC2 domain-containing protein [Planctomycetes bacterium]|nr:zf-HC2 domain-containing protein [Planctomycetota bacterium]